MKHHHRIHHQLTTRIRRRQVQLWRVRTGIGVDRWAGCYSDSIEAWSAPDTAEGLGLVLTRLAYGTDAVLPACYGARP